MKACWLISRNAGTGAPDIDPSRPDMPAPTAVGDWTTPGSVGKRQVHGDIVRLTGPAALPHRHLLVGGIALADDNLDGLSGDGHVHYVGDWGQVTVDAPDHTHTGATGPDGQLIPDFFLLFWAGSDVYAAAIAAHAACFPIVEADMSQDNDGNWSIGDLKAGWATHTTAWWRAQMLDVLGVQLPAEVNNGRRLVRLLLGALLSRQTSDERGYRYTS